MKEKTIDILGSEYRIIFIESEEEKSNFKHLTESYGVTLSESRVILVHAFCDDPIPYPENIDKNVAVKNHISGILRHEILHAYLNECGLKSNASISVTAWPRNEEMVDWFATLSPKIFKTYKELDIL